MKKLREIKRWVILIGIICFIMFVFHIYWSIAITRFIRKPIVSSWTYIYSNGSVRNDNKQCFRLIWDFPKNGSKLDTFLTRKCKRVVTIDGSLGRTGNQMFQIAAIFGMAYRNDLIPVIPLSFPLLKYFDLPNVVNISNTTIQNNIIYSFRPALYKSFSKQFKLISNFTMDGNFMSWKYFDKEKNIIRKILRLKSIHILNAERYIKIVNPHRYTQVCIHIRRGDYFSQEYHRQGFSVADEHFVERARRVYIQNQSNVIFIVASNDRVWCSKKLKNVTISPFDNPGDDMALMALSDHVIVSSGSFGWWGAWLSNGRTVYYNGFPRPESELDIYYFNKKDYYPNDWIGLI